MVRDILDDKGVGDLAYVPVSEVKSDQDTVKKNISAAFLFP